ncbi:pseudouridine synthase [Xylanibacter muris]|uniref:pseudouridine synthase n=1 Tax=Xylanibacter muris TaxID=2736290 RepID=UPI00258F8D4C|nr:pseudouridine synthase [Xylanibacter muris]
MDFENEKKPEEMLNEQNAGSREGYQTSGQTGNYQSYRTPGRSPRPRIHQSRPYNNQRPGYNKGGNDDGGFRPEGFGAGLQSGAPQRQYRPRYNNNNADGGYQQRGGYNNNRGGYQQQGGYNNNRGGGFRPRYNNNGEGEDNTGYQQSGYGQQGYNNNRGGYQQRGGYNNNRGGYGQQGYNNRGGYQQRGGYNNNRGGYGQQGYNNNRGGYRQHSADYDPNAKYSFKKRIEYKEENYDPNEPIRLNKFLANAGVCSRREADEFIQAGVVSVNGTVVTELGTKVLRNDVVKFHDQIVNIEKKVYVLLNKPKDYVTTSDDPQQRKTVMDIVKNACSERIYPVGRLDRNTTGVLLLTNDGNLASKLTHPKFLKKKIYHVYLDRNITAHDLQQIRDGIMLEDGEIKADAVEYADATDKKQVGIEIHSGKNRIVRRIFESLGYRVTKLDRVQFAGLTKKNLRRGDWRYLTEEEVDRLRMGAYE